ncbi:MAG: hypothetical protein FWG50_12555 [Kiritimatiellaeota bacterium]|nr:hypothetical protein [Kiritimatiellota bacterium]
MAAAVDSNVVGYTTKPLAANQKAISGAQFVEVGEEGLDLASIKLENVSLAGGASIQWWNGAAYETAVWVDEVDDIPNNIGWGDAGSWEAVAHTFAPGEGFWIVTPPGASNAKVTQAGEVALSELVTYDADLAANKKFMMINPLPTDLSLADISLVGVSTAGGASIQWWNGFRYEIAAWVDEVDDIQNNIGWGDAGTWEAVSHTFSPTEGFWIVVPPNAPAPQVKIANNVML